jgi:hypothetical protein
MVERARDKASDLADTAKSKAGDAAEAAKARAESARARAGSLAGTGNDKAKVSGAQDVPESTYP